MARVSSKASAWRQCASISSISSSGGTLCSSTNTARRIGAACARASSHVISSMRTIAESIIRAMKSLWSDAEAAKFEGPLGPRVYTSRLLGRDKSLVLHGGGNTSVKLKEKNLFGEEQELLYVKGSGWDLETIEAPGFTPVALS